MPRQHSRASTPHIFSGQQDKVIISMHSMQPKCIRRNYVVSKLKLKFLDSVFYDAVYKFGVHRGSI